MSAQPLLSTLVLYLYAHDALRQRNKGVYDNLQFFIRNGIAPASHESAREAFSLLVSGSSPAHLTSAAELEPLQPLQRWTTYNPLFNGL